MELNTFVTNHASFHKKCRNKTDDEKLNRAKKRKSPEDVGKQWSPIKTSQSISSGAYAKAKDVLCIFCAETGGADGLHKASTVNMDFKVRTCTTLLKDTKLLSKLALGDMVPIEVQYHAKCLALLYTR